MDAGQASRASCAAAIGTVAIETASTFAPVREAFWLSEEWRRDNLRYYPFYGRGFIQLTWESNYRSVGERIGIELVGSLDRAMDGPTAALVFADYFRSRDIQEQADRGDLTSVRRSVQGGSAGLDRLIQIVRDLG